MGLCIEMQSDDFLDWKNGLSQGKASKDSRPLLDEVCEAKFEAGEAKMFFKRSFETTEYLCADFLMKRYRDVAAEKRFMSSQVVKAQPPLDNDRKQDIIKKLCPLMPTDRKDFWLHL